MKSKDIFIYGIIAVLIFLLIQEKCNFKSTPEKPTVTIKEKVTPVTGGPDTAHVPTPTIYIPTIVEKTRWLKGATDTITQYKNDPYQIPDTITIPGNCPAIPFHVYSDTLRLDTLGYVIVYDTVQGSILSRNHKYVVNKFERTITITTNEKRTVFYLGIDGGYVKGLEKTYLGGNASLKFKNGIIIEARYGFIGDNQFYGGGVKFPISLRRKK